MTAQASSVAPIPRLPVLGWSSWASDRGSHLPSLLDIDGAQFTTSGRAAILLALESLGIGPGQRVLVPTYHCPTMVAPISLLGADPLFYPVDASGAPMLTWLGDQDLGGVKAMLVAHFFGIPQPMEVVRRWCDNHGVVLIEDCAHALFGRSEGRAVGAWGHLAIGSLTKFLPVTSGGLLRTERNVPLASSAPMANLRAIVDMLEIGTQHGRLPGLTAIVATTLALARWARPSWRRARAGEPGQPAESDQTNKTTLIDPVEAHASLPFVSRWLAAQLPRGRAIARRRSRYEQFARRLSGVRGLRPLMPNLPIDCAPYVFPLWVDEPEPGYAYLRDHRMPVSRWDWLWPGTPELLGDHGRKWAHHVLQLACHQDLTEIEVDRVADVLIRLYAHPSGLATCSPGSP